MAKEVKIKVKNVVFNAVITFFIIATINYFIQVDFSKYDFIEKKLNEINHSQKIAPNRLYINVWRIAQNEFQDSSMNNQDWKRWRNKYLSHIKTTEDAYVAIETMLSSLNDPRTKFLSSYSYKERKTILDSEITNIGVVFDKTKDKIVINHVLDDTSKDDISIKKGDIIVAIDGKDVTSLEKEELSTLIEKKKTNKLSITVKRNNEYITKEVKKTTKQIKTIDFKITKDNIGIITVTNLMGNKSVIDFVNAIIKTNKTKGIIIDLRNNFGGIIVNSIEISNYMFNNKKITTIKAKNNEELQIYSQTKSVFRRKPVVIIVNKNTASAAEILAGTLQENINAIILGENTYGKNSIQKIIPSKNKTGVQITTGKYLLPSGKDINEIGLNPDIPIESTLIKINDEVMKKAINIIRQKDSRTKKN